MKKYTLFICLMFLLKALQACTCIDTLTAEGAYKKSDLIFTGKVIAAKEVIRSPYYNDTAWAREFGETEFEYTIQIIKTYKGKFKTSTIDIRTGYGAGDCGFLFEMGKEYLIYAQCDYHIVYINMPKNFNKKARENIFRTDICTRTSPIEYSKEDLIYLGN